MLINHIMLYATACRGGIASIREAEAWHLRLQVWSCMAKRGMDKRYGVESKMLRLYKNVRAFRELAMMTCRGERHSCSRGLCRPALPAARPFIDC